MSANLKLHVLKTARDVRRKFLQLRKGEHDLEEQTAKSLRPISEPLQKLISQQNYLSPLLQQRQPLAKIEVPEEYEVQKKEVQKKEVSKNKVRKKEAKFIDDGDVFELEENRETDDDDDGDEDNISQIESNISVSEDTAGYKEFLLQFDPLPRQYLLQYLNQDGIDPKGLKYDVNTSKWSIGLTPVTIEGKDFIIDGLRYEGTPGLYELLFKSNPVGTNQRDEANYRDILLRTNLYRKNHDSTQQVLGNKGYKYKKIVQPLLSSTYARPRANTIDSLRRKSTTGGLLIANDNAIDYRYFDDPNELVERLSLLKASQRAGNNSVQNEIVAIEEELKELSIIY